MKQTELKDKLDTLILGDTKDGSVSLFIQSNATYAKANLYRVKHERSRETENGVKLYPTVIECYVIASCEEGAIAQSVAMAFPELSNAYLPAEKLADVKSEAFVVPFLIRGWGSRTF